MMRISTGYAAAPDAWRQANMVPTAGACMDAGECCGYSNKGVFGMTSNDADFVSRFVRTMDNADRCLLMLFYAEGLSMGEISLVLDQPEFRIESRLDTIRKRTKAALKRFVAA